MLKTASAYILLPVSVPNGGTGRTSLPAGYVLIGNGSGPINSVAPGNVGNALVSTGNTWVSQALSTGNISGLGTMALQNANAVAITGGSIDGTTVGSTTPAAGTFTTLTANSTSQFGKSSANYIQADGAATTLNPIISIAGSDTNVSMVLKPQGTGALDIAAGSKGVNISNGGTVTAITRTSGGSNYTSLPTVTVSAPTTAGGVQATLGITLWAESAAIASGGTGYTAGDVLTVSGGTFTSAAQITVATVSGGVITSIGSLAGQRGSYTVVPSNNVSVTGGTGSGATFTINWGVNSTITITNAGSGYVEQPTVSFSGGGGSGAAAYATVGAAQIVRGLNDLSFYTPGGEAVRIADRSLTTVNYVQLSGAGTTNAPRISGQGSDTNISLFASSKGTSSVSFYTNNFNQEQFRVSHTASAVNYVQVTGAATNPGASSLANILFTGSDSNLSGAISVKGTTGYIAFSSGASTNSQAFRILMTNAASTGNLIAVQGAAAGSAPSIQAISGASGTDANIDLALTPKGTGLVRFGTRTATSDVAITGYIEIKDSGGTTRKLAVID